jgi:hypothetical protein
MEDALMWKCPARTVVVERPRLRKSETIVMVAPKWLVLKVALTAAVVATLIVEARMTLGPTSPRVR